MENVVQPKLTGMGARLADLGLRKTIYDKTFGFVRVGLTEKEHSELMKAIRESHNQQFEECIQDAQELLKPFGRTTKNQVLQVAVALFERKTASSYTLYQEVLARKIHDIKNNNDA